MSFGNIVGLIPSSNHGTKKPRIRSQNVQNVIEMEFYQENMKRLKQDHGIRLYPKLMLNSLKEK
jgi:hypothetical protein